MINFIYLFYYYILYDILELIEKFIRYDNRIIINMITTEPIVKEVFNKLIDNYYEQIFYH
jgi:hypothetical protein